MKFLRHLLLALVLLPVWAWAFSPALQIRVESEWGNASPVDVKAVLDSVVLTMTPYIGLRSLGDIVVRNDRKGPISLYERGSNDEYVILLDVHGRYWAQLAYQFSHEVCHLLSNYDLAPNNSSRQQWFEESLCEAFSLYTLEQMARDWETDPPYPEWRDYAPELQKYVDHMLNQRHRNLATNLPEWYREHRSILEDNPYAQDRRLNEKFASHLLAIFQQQPLNWQAINYLNLGAENGDHSFQKYLDDWYTHTPQELRFPIEAISQVLDGRVATLRQP
ncbi:MAG: hypothetical protein KDI44_14165 [Thiothrix sp.]|nr:hypothetical protein [Thiothrix sp.]HPQ95179.1 hypothetical protein [Thiolinea sp.]